MHVWLVTSASSLHVPLEHTSLCVLHMEVTYILLHVHELITPICTRLYKRYVYAGALRGEPLRVRGNISGLQLPDLLASEHST